MGSESDYRKALELTQQMQAAASAQQWDELCRVENERAVLVAAIAATAKVPAAQFDRQQASSTAEIIREIERINAEIVEHVQAWQQDARVLLRLETAKIA